MKLHSSSTVSCADAVAMNPKRARKAIFLIVQMKKLKKIHLKILNFNVSPHHDFHFKSHSQLKQKTVKTENNNGSQTKIKKPATIKPLSENFLKLIKTSCLWILHTSMLKLFIPYIIV